MELLLYGGDGDGENGKRGKQPPNDLEGTCGRSGVEEEEYVACGDAHKRMGGGWVQKRDPFQRIGNGCSARDAELIPLGREGVWEAALLETQPCTAPPQTII